MQAIEERFCTCPVYSVMNRLEILQTKLQPLESLFFTWLGRVCLAAVLVGAAWIDDAPPLEIAALVIGLYTVIRVAMQFGALAAAVPLDSKPLRYLVAMFLLVLLAFAFFIVVTLVETLSLAAVNY